MSGVRPSVLPSVCLSHRSEAATAAGGFAAERPAGRRYRLIAASALRAPCCRRRRSAANAGSVVLRADEAGSTESSYFTQLYFTTKCDSKKNRIETGLN